MEVRTLQPSEHEALLALLEGWEVGDAWSGGRDFFRRYLEDDPTCSDDNLWVAAEAGELLCCVQIFPRSLRVGRVEVPMGGIGSVYTRPDRRRRGVAEAVLERVVAAMTARGMEISLLFAARHAWYTKLGWRCWGCQRTRLASDFRTSQPFQAPDGIRFEAFDPVRDGNEVMALHTSYCRNLPGSVVRDPLLWQASLHNAGNPGEDFRVVRSGSQLLAYARGVHLEGAFQVMEFARSTDAMEPLAELVARLVLENRPPGRSPPAFTVDLRCDPELSAALEHRGLSPQLVPDPSLMLRCLDERALAERLGIPAPEGPDANAFLATLLPPEELIFWISDRF